MDNAKRGVFTSFRLLVASGLALLVAAAGTAAYPHLASVETPPQVLIALRATIVFCLAAVFLLPVAALVRRLVR